jgi:hypothetical protein
MLDVRSGITKPCFDLVRLKAHGHLALFGKDMSEL